MSDQHNYLTVALDRDYKDEDSKRIVDAIRMIKGVLKVEPNVVAPADWVAEERAQQAMRSKLFDLLNL